MHWLEMIVTIVCTVAASSGFWAWLQAHDAKKGANTKMILGLGHDRIIYLCEKYIERGWISTEEYENLNDYLYAPYIKLGGNGTAKRLMAIVDNLPTRNVEYTASGHKIESDREAN